jgi:hypothetical protein
MGGVDGSGHDRRDVEEPELVVDRLGHRVSDSDHDHDGKDSNHDSQRGKPRPEPVGPEGFERQEEYFEKHARSVNS